MHRSAMKSYIGLFSPRSIQLLLFVGIFAFRSMSESCMHAFQKVEYLTSRLIFRHPVIQSVTGEISSKKTPNVVVKHDREDEHSTSASMFSLMK